MRDYLIDEFNAGKYIIKIFQGREVPNHMSECFYLKVKVGKAWITLKAKFETESGAIRHALNVMCHLSKHGSLSWPFIRL